MLHNVIPDIMRVMKNTMAKEAYVEEDVVVSEFEHAVKNDDHIKEMTKTTHNTVMRIGFSNYSIMDNSGDRISINELKTLNDILPKGFYNIKLASSFTGKTVNRDTVSSHHTIEPKKVYENLIYDGIKLEHFKPIFHREGILSVHHVAYVLNEIGDDLGDKSVYDFTYVADPKVFKRINNRRAVISDFRDYFQQDTWRFLIEEREAIKDDIDNGGIYFGYEVGILETDGSDLYRTGIDGNRTSTIRYYKKLIPLLNRKDVDGVFDIIHIASFAKGTRKVIQFPGYPHKIVEDSLTTSSHVDKYLENLQREHFSSKQLDPIEVFSCESEGEAYYYHIGVDIVKTIAKCNKASRGTYAMVNINGEMKRIEESNFIYYGITKDRNVAELTAKGDKTILEASTLTKKKEVEEAKIAKEIQGMKAKVKEDKIKAKHSKKKAKEDAKKAREDAKKAKKEREHTEKKAKTDSWTMTMKVAAVAIPILVGGIAYLAGALISAGESSVVASIVPGESVTSVLASTVTVTASVTTSVVEKVVSVGKKVFSGIGSFFNSVASTISSTVGSMVSSVVSSVSSFFGSIF